VSDVPAGGAFLTLKAGVIKMGVYGAVRVDDLPRLAASVGRLAQQVSAGLDGGRAQNAQLRGMGAA
jgi:hypothetical protein